MGERAKFAALLLLASASCKERPPPPGSGAIETTPTADGPAGATPALASPDQIKSFPGGALLVAEPSACRVRALDSSKQLWIRDFPECKGLLELAVARDSTAYVRAGRALIALELSGRERWRVLLETDVPRAIARPTALADSRAAIAESPRSVLVYDAQGREAWRFSLPGNEALVAPPEGLPTEGVALLAGVSSYRLGADGTLRWRVPTGGK